MNAPQAVTLEAIGELFDRKFEQKFEQKFEEKFEQKFTEKFAPLYGFFNERFSRIDARFERVESAIYSLQEGHLLHMQITRDIQRRVITLEDSIADAQESLDFLSLAEEKDAEATINHELRIARLEKENNLRGTPPKHLTELD